MSIDRIGGPSSPAPIGAADAARALDKPESLAPEQAEAPGPAEQVRAGSLEVGAYVDLRVDEATRHLEGSLSAADLEVVRDTLKSELLQDATLRSLAEAAIGRPLEEP